MVEEFDLNTGNISPINRREGRTPIQVMQYSPTPKAISRTQAVTSSRPHSKYPHRNRVTGVCRVTAWASRTSAGPNQDDLTEKGLESAYVSDFKESNRS